MFEPLHARYAKPSNAWHHPPAHNAATDKLTMASMLIWVGCMPLLGAARRKTCYSRLSSLSDSQ
jgi:hypothetical protein